MEEKEFWKPFSSEREYIQQLCLAVVNLDREPENIKENLLKIYDMAHYYLLICGDGIKRDGEMLGILQ